MSKRIVLGALLVAVIAWPVRADFNSLVRAVSRQRGIHRVWIPGLGLARMAVWMIHPSGVYDFQLATFEGEARFDDVTFERLLRENSDAGFTPLVRAFSRRSGEMTMIWARPGRGDRIELMLLTHDPKEETVVLRAVIDADALARQVNDPRHITVMARR